MKLFQHDFFLYNNTIVPTNRMSPSDTSSGDNHFDIFEHLSESIFQSAARQRERTTCETPKGDLWKTYFYRRVAYRSGAVGIVFRNLQSQPTQTMSWSYAQRDSKVDLRTACTQISRFPLKALSTQPTDTAD